MVELAGLDQVWLGFDYLTNAKLTLYYPKGPAVTFEYKCGDYSAANDKKIIEEAKKDYDQMITKEIPCDLAVRERLK